MKSIHTLLWLLAASLFTSSAFAIEEPFIGINSEFGLNGNYGLFGAELFAHPSDHLDAHAGVGVGVTPLGGGGFRVYTHRGECFLFKMCSERYFLSATVAQTLGSKLTAKDPSGSEREYSIPKTSFLNLAVGDSTVFFGHLNTMMHIGYKIALNKSESKLIKGEINEDEQNDLDEQLQSGLQISFSLGLEI